MPVALVAIVAMFLYAWAYTPQLAEPAHSSAYSVHQKTQPPRVIYVVPPSLPDRNPHRN